MNSTLRRNPARGLPRTGVGKFEGGLRVAELAYCLSLDGCDDECGDVGTTGWFGLLDGAIDPHGVPSAELGWTPNNDECEFLDSCVGCIIEEDNNGFVSVVFLDSHDALARLWESIAESVAEDEDCEDD